MSALSILVSPKYLTTLLLRLTERSATLKNIVSVHILSPYTFSAQEN